MAELRETHLPKSSAKKKTRGPTKSARIFAMQKKLQAAYEPALPKRKQ